MTQFDLEEHESSDDEPWKDPTWLYQKYHREGCSLSDIADLTPVSSGTIKYYMEKHSIERREMRDAVIKSHLTSPVSYSVQSKGYPVWQHNYKRKKDHVKIHRLLAVAEYGYDSVVKKHVHHRNGIPWDNRPQNIELMNHGEHATHHNRISAESLLDALQELAEELGRPPSASEMNDLGRYSETPYKDRFGSWSTAKIEAGVNSDTPSD